MLGTPFSVVWWGADALAHSGSRAPLLFARDHEAEWGVRTLIPNLRSLG